MGTFVVVVDGARIVRFEKGRKVHYGPGKKVELSSEELERYKFITAPVQAQAAKPEVRNAVPPVEKK